MSAEPTRRQIEAMLSTYHGKSPFAAPGSDGRYTVRNAGGAARRMIERIGDAGWFQQRYSRHGRCITEWKFTAAGLEALGAKHPDLPELAERLEAQRAAELAIADQEAAELAEQRRHREAKAIERQAARIAAMREIAQRYQVRLDLMDEQCLAMWLEIIEREHDL